MSLKNIVVEDITYFWSFSQKYLDGYWLCRVYFSPATDKSKKYVECLFKCADDYYGGCALNVGFKTKRYNEDTIINLNQPGIISQIIDYLIKTKLDFEQCQHYCFDNGWTILNELGYHIPANLIVE